MTVQFFYDELHKRKIFTLEDDSLKSNGNSKITPLFNSKDVDFSGVKGTPGDDFLIVSPEMYHHLDGQTLFLKDEHFEYHIIKDLPLIENRPIEQIGRVTISGRGSQTSQDCGKFISAYKTESEKILKHFSCHLQGCPICFRDFATRRAESASYYLRKVKEYVKGKYYHCTISPANPNISIAELKKMVKKLFNKYHVGPGPIGYSWVDHPYRYRCSVCKSPMENSHKHYRKCSTCGSEEGVWVFSYHAHLITNFYYDATNPQVAKEFAKELEKLGFVYVNISQHNKQKAVKLLKKLKDIPKEKRDDGWRKLRVWCNRNKFGYIINTEALRGTLRYELSHAMFVQGKIRHSVLYFGSFAKCNYKKCNEKELIVDITDSKGEPFKKVWSRVVYSYPGANIIKISDEFIFGLDGLPIKATRRIKTYELLAKNNIKRKIEKQAHKFRLWKLEKNNRDLQPLSDHKNLRKTSDSNESELSVPI